MTSAPDNTAKVVSIGTSDFSETRAGDTRLAVVEWFAREKSQTFNAAAVAGRLPHGTDLTKPEGLARALEVISLRSRFVLKDVRRLDPVVFPCVVFQKDGPPLVVTGIERKMATVVDPAAADMLREIRLRDLRRRIKPGVLLVTEAEDAVNRRLDPASALPRNSHWFWGAVRANWGAWSQIVLAAFCMNVLALALPLFVMNVYDRVIPNLAFVTLWTLALGVAIALALDLILRSARVSIIERIGRRVDLKVASSLFAQAMNVKLLTRPGGAAGMANTIRDFDIVRDFFASTTVVSLIDLLFIGIFLGALYMIVGPIALVPLLAVPLVMILAFIAQIPMGRAAEQAQRIATKRHVVLVESLVGVESIKSLNAEPVMQREWETAVAAAARVNSRTKTWSSVASHGTMLIQQAVSVIIIVWGVFLVAAGEITVGGLIAANILAGRVLSPLGTIAQTIFRAQHAVKALKNLDAFMDLPTERGPTVTSDLRASAGQLEFRKVTFTYPGTPNPVLSELSFAMKPGETLGILGKVGSGKTTMGKIAIGLIEPQSGQVLLDDIAITQYDPAELRRAVGYLPQQPDLFTGTLRENLTIGAADACDEAIHKALYYAAMDSFVSALPDGIETFLGEQGNRLSGGQKQGLALARILLRRPKLLFLDEPSSAMDHRMEALVAERLNELSKTGMGMILCTHRMSLANIVGRLMVIDQGKVLMDGPRADVLAKLANNAPKAD
ncbi:type I secretion system permease/ATPase [Aestuariivita boseongensis]|uniref:type I secretion system permease/ATPase n=1 Tax=Aestuariivita boseongensis TaxID=1470562 RepID=UPI000680E52E|nr:type I secretion system permease/ATPase [Aestuariivita boseongensis]